MNEYSMFKTMSRIQVGSNSKWSYQDYALSKDMDSLDSIGDFEN